MDSPSSALHVAVQYDFRREQAFLRACASGISMVVFLGAAIAYRTVVFALKPLSQLVARADEISSSRRAHALPEVGIAGEIRELSQAFDRMLSRLNDSFIRLTEFSSDLARDIRTPLTNLLAQAQVTAVPAALTQGISCRHRVERRGVSMPFADG
ncbi:HAMP domain-containing protein [Paraburkholderia aspalathi]|uniref:HAMP domain-containing protein n=1 Tax=Paraburkholderia aspalathi TaxID=1324617 RepID=UPI0038B8E4AD